MRPTGQCDRYMCVLTANSFSLTRYFFSPERPNMPSKKYRSLKEVERHIDTIGDSATEDEKQWLKARSSPAQESALITKHSLCKALRSLMTEDPSKVAKLRGGVYVLSVYKPKCFHPFPIANCPYEHNNSSPALISRNAK